jgi:hypothetical protein
MKNIIKTIKSKKLFILYLSIFLFFLLISCFIPINGDDWGNYIIGVEGIKTSINNAISMYFDWEGRFISRIIINILTCHKWLWNIMNALIMTSIFIIINKIIKPKNKIIIGTLLFLGIILVDTSIFTQGYVWLAGNITYIFPLLLILIYLYFNNYIFSCDFYVTL